MVHACACCRLRFASVGELADHVEQEHTEHPPFEEGKTVVTRPRFPAGTWFGGTRRSTAV